MENEDKSPKLSAKQRKIRLTIKASAILLVLIFFVYGFSMQTVKYTVDSEKINEKIKIVFISDLHNCFYGGTDQSALIEEIDNNSPDIVLFGGDIIDEYGGTQYALAIMELASEKYNCCYSPGNHEMLRDDYDEFRKQVENLGIYVLEGSSVCFNINNQTVNVFGAVDALEGIPDDNNPFITQLDSCIELSKRNADDFNILLGHQPEIIDSYLNGEFDLILSGHAHGGQWRFPIILEQGFWAPDQGFRPKYTNGMFEHEDSVHIISKGLARPLRMILIPRIYNRPEFTIIEIE